MAEDVQCIFCRHHLHAGERYVIWRGQSACWLCVIDLSRLDPVPVQGEQS